MTHVPHGESESQEPEGPSATEVRVFGLLDGIRDHATFLLGPRGHIETWSRSAEHITGFTCEEVMGKHISLLYPAEQVAAGEPNHELARAEVDGQVETEVRRERRDGRRFAARVGMTALHTHAGHVRGFVVVLRDLTEQRRTSEEGFRAFVHSEERFRLLVEGVKDYAIFMLDPAGGVVTWNAGAERIHGYRADEIIGERATRLLEGDAGQGERELEVAEREGRFEEEGWRRRKDGSLFWASVVLTALRDGPGTLLGYAGVVRDLTHLRRIEEERVRLAQAEEAIRLRDEFLSIASHELKTPLTALQLQVQGLLHKVRDADPALGTRLERAARSGQRLADLIETLLDVSRIATGRFELHRECFDLAEGAREVVERMHESAVKAGCEVALDAPAGLVGSWDRLRLEQVLTNLLANAFKYGAGKPVEVTLAREGDVVMLNVADRGPGIAPEDLARIFGRFERAVSMRNYGGLGLGLYVARQIVEAHGGTVGAHNVPGAGAHFTVRLPLDDSSPAAGPA